MIGILVELKLCIHHLYNVCIWLMHSIVGVIYKYIFFKRCWSYKILYCQNHSYVPTIQISNYTIK